MRVRADPGDQRSETTEPGRSSCIRVEGLEVCATPAVPNVHDCLPGPDGFGVDVPFGAANESVILRGFAQRADNRFDGMLASVA